MHRSRSSGVGLFAGGAQRTAAAMYASRNFKPSPARTDSGRFANPVRYNDANKKSPERSPVNTRPVRLPPWAAGASPTSRRRAPCVAEARHRLSPVLLVPERGALLVRNVLAPRDETGARPARDDLRASSSARLHSAETTGTLDRCACCCS